MKPRTQVPLWLLASFTFSSTLAMHIFVPALPLAALSLNASPGAMQLTISLYIAGLALGQLAYGPLSDRFGRRPALMLGLAICTLAGLATVMATSAGALIAARFFQALGGCAGMVLGRAIVRDTSGLTDAARRLALLNLMVTIGPGVAPLIGSTLAATTGWRSILYALTGLGVLNLLFCWRLLPETGSAAAKANADVRVLMRHYRSLLGSPAFLGYAVGGGCATTAMYAFVASAPFVFVHQLGRPPYEVGIYLALLIAGVWIGSLLTTRLIQRVEMHRLLVRANAVSVLAASFFLVGALTGQLDTPWAVGSMFVFNVGAGVASPAALTEAISVNPAVTGSASGLYGFTQMAVGALCTALATLGGNPALSAGLVLVGAGVVGQSAFWLAARQRRSEAAA